ncbi:MAG: redoxin domain-containing protein [Bacteroidetes bacterium]|nr:redoxin domain-containing protein [Bacteroidota bacterium]
MKKYAMAFLLGLIFAAITAFFWFYDWKYSLPTPVPLGYKSVNCGTPIGVLGRLQSGNRPLFLHFFNPACPCSRFNIPHFRSLVNQYGSKVDFAIVVMSDKKHTAEEIQNRLGVDIPVLFDSAIARACGVYSTPQAAIISPGHRLYYRGNYNKSRYCTNKNSDYARMALEDLLNDHPDLSFSPYAVKAYGCELPTCTK